MKILLKLLKIDLINSLSFSQFKTTKKYKGKSKSPLITSLITILISFGIYFIYMYFFSQGAHLAEDDNLILVIGIGLGGIMTLLMTFGKAHSILFRGKDFEFLTSMPIPTSTIVASKILSLLLLNYLYFAMPFLPAVIYYFVFAGFTFKILLFVIIFFLFGPLVPTILCTILSFIMGALLEKSKFKNILSIISMIIVFVAIFFLTFNFEMGLASEGEENPFIEFAKGLGGFLKKGYFLSNFADKAMNGELLFLLLYVLVGTIPLIAFVFIIAKFFVRINSNGNSTYKNKNFKLESEIKKTRRSRPVLALLKKEAKTLFGIPTYCINVIIGPILSVIMIIVLCLTFNSNGVEDGFAKAIITTILCIASMFALTMITSTSTSISMEGKKFWIIKSSPLKTEQIFMAKLLLYILLCLPMIIINSVFVSIYWKLGILDILFFTILPLIHVPSIGAFGLWINTCKYRFDWTNPVQAVKQGTETLFSMLLSFVFDIVLIVPTIMFGGFFFHPLFVTLIMAILIAILNFSLLFINGKKRFEAIEI